MINEMLIFLLVFCDVILSERIAINVNEYDDGTSECNIIDISDDSIELVLDVSDSWMNDMDNEYEYIGVIQHDSDIWDYEIPPNPFHVLTHINGNKINDKTVVFNMDDINPNHIYKFKVYLIHKDTNCAMPSTLELYLSKSNNFDVNDSILKRDRDINNKWLDEDSQLNDEYIATSKQYDLLRKYPELKQWNDNYLTNDFKTAIQTLNFQNIITRQSETIYKIHHIFTPQFLDQIRHELIHAKQLVLNQSIILTKPNTMNNDGFVLKELGFNDFFSTFITNYFTKLTNHIYPFYHWYGNEISTFHGFSIRYLASNTTQHTNDTTDTELDKHMDQSDITLNICLYNDDHTNSKVYFDGIRDDPSSTNDHINISLHAGEALLHVGQLWHGASTIQFGERMNLILWLRSIKSKQSVLSQYIHACMNEDKPAILSGPNKPDL